MFIDIYLERLLEFVKSHDMENCRIENDSVVFGIPYCRNGEFWGIEEVTVKTFHQAKIQLGY